MKVKNDMKIEVPAEIFNIKKYECEVVSNHNVATFIKEFVVKLPEGEVLNFEAGEFTFRSIFLHLSVDLKTLRLKKSLEMSGISTNFGILIPIVTLK